MSKLVGVCLINLDRLLTCPHKCNKHFRGRINQPVAFICCSAWTGLRANTRDNVKSPFTREARHTVNTTHQQLNTHYSYHYHEVLFRYDGLGEHWSHQPALSEWAVNTWDPGVWSNSAAYWQPDTLHRDTQLPLHKKTSTNKYLE